MEEKKNIPISSQHSHAGNTGPNRPLKQPAPEKPEAHKRAENYEYTNRGDRSSNPAAPNTTNAPTSKVNPRETREEFKTDPLDFHPTPAAPTKEHSTVGQISGTRNAEGQ